MLRPGLFDDENVLESSLTIELLLTRAMPDMYCVSLRSDQGIKCRSLHFQFYSDDKFIQTIFNTLLAEVCAWHIHTYLLNRHIQGTQ